jgi:hypothetical protein
MPQSDELILRRPAPFKPLQQKTTVISPNLAPIEKGHEETKQADAESTKALLLGGDLFDASDDSLAHHSSTEVLSLHNEPDSQLEQTCRGSWDEKLVHAAQPFELHEDSSQPDPPQDLITQHPIASALPYSDDPVMAARQKSVAIYTDMALFYAGLQKMLDQAIKAHAYEPDKFDGLKAVFSQAAQDCASLAGIATAETTALAKAHAHEANRLAAQASSKRLDVELDQLFKDIEALPKPEQQEACKTGVMVARQLAQDTTKLVPGLDNDLVNWYCGANGMRDEDHAQWADEARADALDNDLIELHQLAIQASKPKARESIQAPSIPFNHVLDDGSMNDEQKLDALFAQLERSGASESAEIDDLTRPLREAFGTDSSSNDHANDSDPGDDDLKPTELQNQIDDILDRSDSERQKPDQGLKQAVEKGPRNPDQAPKDSGLDAVKRTGRKIGQEVNALRAANEAAKKVNDESDATLKATIDKLNARQEKDRQRSERLAAQTKRLNQASKRTTGSPLSSDQAVKKLRELEQATAATSEKLSRNMGLKHMTHFPHAEQTPSHMESSGPDIAEALAGTTGSPFAPTGGVREDTSARRLRDLPRDTVRQLRSVFRKR